MNSSSLNPFGNSYNEKAVWKARRRCSLLSKSWRFLPEVPAKMRARGVLFLLWVLKNPKPTHKTGPARFIICLSSTTISCMGRERAAADTNKPRRRTEEDVLIFAVGCQSCCRRQRHSSLPIQIIVRSFDRHHQQ
jgi:hypothetical protein